MTRLLSAGGVVGPFLFVTGWLVLGYLLQGYSPISTAISELARSGRWTQPWMTAAFLAFAVGVFAFALAARSHFGGSWWIAAAVVGVATIGVAAAPLGANDRGHFIFAAITYCALASLPILASQSFSGTARTMCLATGALTAIALLYSVIGPKSVHGLFQRVGFTIADIWIAVVAVAIFMSSKR